MTEITLKLNNPADEHFVFEFLQRMGIAFSAFKEELNSSTTTRILTP